MSEFFSMLGGPRALSDEPLSGAQFWRLLSEAEPDLRATLCCAPVPEVLAPAAPAPIALVTLPHLTAAWPELLAAVRDRVTRHPPAAAAVHSELLFRWLQRRLARRVWVERSGGSLEYAELLRQRWPRARFVLLLRAGADTALSMAEHPMFRVRVARIVAGDHTLPVGDCLRAQLPAHRFGAYWSALMGKARRLARTLPSSDLHVLHYEELVRSPAPALRALATFITGAAAPAAWVERAAALVAPARSRVSELPPVEREALEAACRPGARYFAPSSNQRPTPRGDDAIAAT